MKLAALAAILLALAGAIAAIGLGSSSLQLRSTVPTGTLTVGQTLIADPSTMVATGKAVGLIDKGKYALCRTLVSGKTFALNRSLYPGWKRGIADLALAQALSPQKRPYDVAGNALLATTISGTTYCAHRVKYAKSNWAIAYAALSNERAALVAHPASSGPSIRTP